MILTLTFKSNTTKLISKRMISKKIFLIISIRKKDNRRLTLGQKRYS
jgi:hypothetical protein